MTVHLLSPTVGFDEWLADRGPALQSFAYLVVRNREDAKDVLQDALIGLLPRWGRFDDPGAAEAYLRRSIVNASISSWRRTGKRLVPVEDMEAWVPSVAASDHRDDAEFAWQLCEELSPVQRACIVLRFREDQSFADIARILEIPEATARSHVHRALARLRSSMEAQR